MTPPRLHDPVKCFYDKDEKDWPICVSLHDLWSHRMGSRCAYVLSGAKEGKDGNITIDGVVTPVEKPLLKIYIPPFYIEAHCIESHRH